ncbi:MAG: acetyl-CoA carboxylase biotin carboxyl carrier protein [Acidobacteriota bacterium]|jgi:acetyl-CoA carboxylase biotin carboxyl carrier protein|nr:acetyl-CoA carboxylase biotin carboxyl carrier protein [Acidobacteriota bacterium]
MNEEGATQPAPDGSSGKEPSKQPEQSGGQSRERDRGRRRHQQTQPRRPEPQLPMAELRDLFELFSEHGLTEFEVEREGIRIHLGRNPAPQVTAHTTIQPDRRGATAPVSAEAGGGAPVTEGISIAETEEAAPEESLSIITSPIVGTFYRSPSPTAEAFVRLGSHVNADTVVCIIEAMKLMNEITAEASGEIAKIYVENGQPVEFGQALFGIKK